MKKLVRTLLIVLITTTTAWAQHPDGIRRIHAAKMAYITDRLRLTTRQSGEFIPLYNDYEMEIRNTRQAFFRKYKGTNLDETDNATARQFIDDNLDYQQQVIEIKRKYNDRFLKVLTPQQLADLYKAEREFKQMLMQRLHQQHGGRMNHHGYGY